MKKSLVTLLAAATLVAATAPAFAQVTVETTTNHTLTDAEAKLFGFKDAAEAEKAAKAKEEAAKKAAADKAAADAKDFGLGKDGSTFVEDIEKNEIPTSTVIGGHAKADGTVDAVLLERTQGTVGETAKGASVTADKKEASLEDLKKAENKVAHKSVAAAATAKGQKTLPKTSAAK